MDNIQRVYIMLSEFVQSFMVKYKYEHRGLLKKIRIDSRLNLDMDENRWSELFLYKSCLNHCAKILLMRLIEDKGWVYQKLNQEGIEKWHSFVKNLGKEYSLLYHIGILDLQGDNNSMIREIFKKSDYDLFEIDKELADIIIQSFSTENFANLEKSELQAIFDKLFSLDQREELQLEKFHKEAPALSYVLNLEKIEELWA